jgi:recombination protein RecR
VLSPAGDNLVAQLTKLPGVGQRTAQRLAFHLLSRPKDEALALATAIEDVKERVRFCTECGNLTAPRIRADPAQLVLRQVPALGAETDALLYVLDRSRERERFVG